MIGNSRFHRRRYADCTVNPAKIIIREIQSKRSPVILPLLAESVCQPSEAPNLHPHREVLTLDMGRAYFLGVGMADNWDYLRGNHFSRRVAPLIFRTGPIHLDELRKINARSKAHVDGINISLEAVRSDLKLSRRGFIQFFNERFGVAGRAAS